MSLLRLKNFSLQDGSEGASSGFFHRTMTVLPIYEAINEDQTCLVEDHKIHG